MMFDTYAIVDWSAAKVPRQRKDSIWICWRGPDGESFANPSTRHAAKALVGEGIAAARANGERVLLGFDFPFGYPAGFAARLGLSGPPWRAVWDEIARLIEDDERNRNNRFDVAAKLNKRVSGREFPFWGRPGRFQSPFLGAKHHRRHDSDGLREKRLVDRWMLGAQPCWKLLGIGAVGGQVLTGIPVVRALRDDPRWAAHARIWPFETGLRPPDDAAIVFAEVWPSWWQIVCWDESKEPKDKAQVRTVARLFSESDRKGELAGLFAGDPSLSPEQRRLVESEEAWTLGVTSARPRPTPPKERAKHSEG
jgi:precorrin-8X/cobalt-precorrin-8 methylmutase